jgi:hypothetical protein
MVEGFDKHMLSKVLKNDQAKSLIQQTIGIEQSARAIWYYNSNLIKLIKIKKK